MLPTPSLIGALQNMLKVLDADLGSLTDGFRPGRPQEHSALSELRNSYCNTAFDPTCATTERRLREIWNRAFPEEPIQSAVNGERWVKLGFQAATPCTDIRAGSLGLDQLYYFASKYPERLRRFAGEAQTLGYPFACSCFNISHIIALFFDLYTTPAMNPVPGARVAGHRQLDNFARLCTFSPDSTHVVLDELFCALVERLHETWRIMRATEDCSMMDFPRALREVYDGNAAFWQHRHSDIADLDEILSRPACEGRSHTKSTLSSFVAECYNELLTVLAAQLSKVMGSLSDTMRSGPITTKLACPMAESTREDMRFGAYVPPMLPVVPPRHTWVVRPTEIDLDSFFESLGLSDAVEAKDAHLEEGRFSPADVENGLEQFLDYCLDGTLASAPASNEG